MGDGHDGHKKEGYWSDGSGLEQAATRLLEDIRTWNVQPSLSDRPGVPLDGDPGRKTGPVVYRGSETPSPKYPGTVNPNDGSAESWAAERLARSGGPGMAVLYQLFKATYTDRSQENNKPGKVLVADLHPGMEQRVACWKMFGDSEISQLNKDCNNRNLRPDFPTNPGHFYTVGFDKSGKPIVIVDYYRDESRPEPRFYQAFEMDYSKTQDGNLRINVSHFMAPDQTTSIRNKNTISPTGDIYVGKTEYIVGSEYCLSVREYSVFNDKLELQFDFGKDLQGVRVASMRYRNPNSGAIETKNVDPAEGQNLLRQHRDKFLFYGLFGN